MGLACIGRYNRYCDWAGYGYDSSPGWHRHLHVRYGYVSDLSAVADRLCEIYGPSHFNRYYYAANCIRSKSNY
ncbi:hypothetical protein D3C78_1155030 [compost metagenome]